MPTEYVALIQGDKTTKKYENELDRLIKFAPLAFMNDGYSMIQKYFIGLGAKLQLVDRSFKSNT